MMNQRPFADAAALFEAASAVWKDMGVDDILEAFATHPRIGAGVKDGDQSAGGEAWSDTEQAGLVGADEATRSDLARLNDTYFERFGFIYIVCATGKPAEELQAILEGRVSNNPEDELRVAAEEQRLITRIRLNKLIA
jgi:OHCU decarboxylase